MNFTQCLAEGIAMIVICLLFMLNGRQIAKNHAITGFLFGALGFIAFVIYVAMVRAKIL